MLPFLPKGIAVRVMNVVNHLRRAEARARLFAGSAPESAFVFTVPQVEIRQSMVSISCCATGFWKSSWSFPANRTKSRRPDRSSA